jgi:IclR family transcriptional regulator, acetate operon repressor
MDVLMLFPSAKSGSLGVTEIAATLGLSKAAVHRVLGSLRSRNLLILDVTGRRYALGPATLSLGLAYLDRLDVRTLALPEMHELMVATQETATLSIRTGDTRIYVEQVLPDREVKMTVPIGKAYPLHTGGSSKAFLAWLEPEALNRYFELPLAKLTADSVISEDALRGELAVIREQGFAKSFGERQAGAASVAAPIFAYDGSVAAVISVAGPSERLRSGADFAAALLTQATTRLSARFGYVDPAAHRDPAARRDPADTEELTLLTTSEKKP